jgi:hypothetical protein
VATLGALRCRLNVDDLPSIRLGNMNRVTVEPDTRKREINSANDYKKCQVKWARDLRKAAAASVDLGLVGTTQLWR